MLLSDLAGKPGALTPQQEQSLLSKVGSHTGKLVSDLLWAIDTPGAVVRSGIDYLQDGEWNNPLTDQRVYGEDILENAGANAGTTRFALGLGLDVLTDPLTFVTGGLTKAGKAAKAMGILDDAAEVASRRIQRTALSAGDDASTIGGRPGRVLKRLDNELEQFVDHSSMPLSGQGAAKRSTTLDEMVQHAVAKEPRAQDALDAFLRKKGWNYDDIKGDTLGRTFGIAGTDIAGDALGKAAGDALALGMDRIGEAARWSKPGVLAHSYFSKAAGNADDAVTQAAAIRINKGADAGQARGNRTAADLAYDLRQAKIDPSVAQRTGISDVFSPGAADAIDRYIEKVAVTANDIDFVENSPGVKEFVDKWGAESSRILRESEAAGLRSHRLDHAYGAGYRPYQMESAMERSAKGGARRAASFDIVTGDMLKRKKALQLPGGLDQLRALSQDDRFVGLGDNFVEDDVTELLFREINDPNNQYYQSRRGTPADQWAQATAAGNVNPAMPQYSKGKARSLAKFLHELPGDTPVFGNHPAEAAARYIAGRERAISTSDELVNTIASMAVAQKASKVQGGRHVSAGAALQKLGLKVGGDGVAAPAAAGASLRQKIAEQISARTGQQVAADTINLAEYAVDLKRLDNIRRMADMFNSPKAKTAVGEFLDQYVKVFKAQVLTWPSRYSRDFLSGGISNLIEVGPSAATWTYRASQLMGGDYDQFLPALKSLPMYQNMSDDAALKAFMQDAAEHRILGGLRVVDNGVQDRTARSLQEIIPGAKDVSLRSVMRGQEGRSWGQFADQARDLAGARGVRRLDNGVKRAAHTNSLYQAGENLGELTDSLNRMGGYLALLSQGVAPREAAERMRAIHVAYDSLSDFEKSLRDSVLPFYAYTSRIGKYVFDELTQRPGGRYSQGLRGLDKLQTSDEDTYVPQTMRERTSIPLAPEVFGKFAEPGPGLRRFATHIDFPGMAAINMGSSVRSGDSIDVAGSALSTFQNVGSMAAPHLRTAVELMSGNDLYTKEKLGARPSPIDQITGAIGEQAGLIEDGSDFKYPPLVNSAVNLMLPGAGRILNAGRQIADDRIEDLPSRLGQMAWNQVGPVRFGVVDERSQRRDAVNQIEDMIERSGYGYTMTNTVVSNEDFAKLPPEMQQLVLLKKSIEQKNRQEKKAKERATKLSLR